MTKEVRQPKPSQVSPCWLPAQHSLLCCTTDFLQWLLQCTLCCYQTDVKCFDIPFSIVTFYSNNLQLFRNAEQTFISFYFNLDYIALIHPKDPPRVKPGFGINSGIFKGAMDPFGQKKLVLTKGKMRKHSLAPLCESISR